MLNKVNIKSFIAGVIATALLGSTAFAAPVESTIKVLYNNIKIYMDDSLVDPRDAKGNSVQPFIYNGTTYLPVRAVANAVGKSVIWDGKTNSIFIGKHEGVTNSVWLEDLEYFNYQEGDSSHIWSPWEPDAKDATGESYSHGIEYQVYNSYWYPEKGWQYTEYLLNQKYKTFKGKFALKFDYRSTRNAVIFKVYGDDKLLYTSSKMTGGVLPEDFNVDVTGVIKMKIEFTNSGPDSGSTYVGLLNAGLTE